MSDAVRIVPEDELTPEQRAYAATRAQRRAAVGARVFDASGNPISIETILAEREIAEEQRRTAEAYTAEMQRQRQAEEREAAREKAEKEAAEVEARQAQLKAQLKAYWVDQRALYTASEFESEWRTNRTALVRDQSDDDYLARKRASGQYY